MFLIETVVRRKLAEDVAAASGGIDLWRLEEPTLHYILGLLVLQVVAREIFKRYGPFKKDAALFAHQVGYALYSVSLADWCHSRNEGYNRGMAC